MIQNSTITSLDFSQIPLTEQGFKHIFEILRHNTTLTDLTIRCSLKRNIVLYVPEHALTSMTLKSLDLGGHSLDVSAITRGLAQNCGSISSLYLDLCGIDCKTAVSIFSAIETNTCITELDLSNNKIYLDGAKAAAKLLKINTTLTNLNMSHTRIGEEGVVAIAEAMVINTTLKVLSLTAAYYTRGDGVKVAFEYLIDVKSPLHTLCMKYNQIKFDTMELILEKMKVNSSILVLDITVPYYGDNDYKTPLMNFIKRNNHNKKRKEKTLVQLTLEILQAPNFFEAFLQKRILLN
jgi:hypothetical protein